MATTKPAAKATKQAASAAPAPAADEVVAGSSVKFLGYAADVPEEERFLTEGEVYTVSEIGEPAEDGTGVAVITIDNPSFNPKKKESDSNPKSISIDVFFDEIELVEGEAEAEAEAEGEAEGEAEAEAAAPAAKTTAKATTKPAAKSTAAKTTGKPAVKATAKPAAKTSAKQEKAADEPPVDKYADLTEDAEDADILAMVKDAENLNDLALELVDEQSNTEYRLGGVLFHVRRTKSYEELDERYKENKGFELFVNEVLGIEYRKAMYLVDIYYKFNKFKIPSEKVSELGWTKASRIAAVMTDDNASDLVELADNSSLSELTESIKTTYSKNAGSGSGSGAKRKTAFKFKLFEDKAAHIEFIMTTAMKNLGLKTLDDAFEHIVGEWGAEHLGEDAQANTEQPATKATAKPASKAASKVRAKA